MHIEHTTHDQCRRPARTEKGAKVLLSAHIGGHSKVQSSPLPARDDDDDDLTKENTYSERPVTIWPTVPINDLENIRTLEERNSTARRSSRDGNGNGKEIHKSAFRRTCELLRRASRSAGSRNGEGEKWHQRRENARAVPSIQTSPTQQQSATTTPSVQRRGSINSAARSARMASGVEHKSSQRAKGSFRTRADEPGGSRSRDRSLGSGKFQPPLGHPTYYPPSTPARHDSRSAAAPLSSSKGTTHKDKVSFQGQSERSTESANRNNNNKNLWRAGPLNPCRLCKTGSSIVGTRGLCRECESDFVRPETLVSSVVVAAAAPSRPYDFEDDNDDEEVKPPVPLKDKKTLAMRRSAASSRSAAGLERADARSDKTAREEDKESVTGGKEGRYWNENDQAMFIEHEKEKTKKIIADWSAQQQEKSQAGESSRRKEGEKKRRTSFYRFWEDILGCD